MGTGTTRYARTTIDDFRYQLARVFEVGKQMKKEINNKTKMWYI